MIERVEDLVKSGKSGDVKAKTGATARLALPKVEPATSATVELSPRSSGRGKSNRSDTVPPPITGLDSGSKAVVNRPAIEDEGRPTDTGKRFGCADLYDAVRRAEEAKRPVTQLPGGLPNLPSTTTDDRASRIRDRVPADMLKGKLPPADATIEPPKREEGKGKAGRSLARPFETPPVNGATVESRRIETPKVESPKVEPRRVETPKVEPRRIETPKVELPRIDMSRKLPSGGGESSRLAAPKETPAPMPRIQPRVESRPMPRVETPRVERSMPRIEVPRESRPAPRIEAPKIEKPTRCAAD